MPTTLNNQAAIVGIGQTEFSKNSGRSELQLSAEAVKAALDDAGLTPSDVDGPSWMKSELTVIVTAAGVSVTFVKIGRAHV